MRLLVTGGAGYIGSVVAAQLIEGGHDVLVLDDESTGHADAVPACATFVRGTVQQDAAAVLASGVDAVLHFAARSLVGESVEKPGLYWSNNLGGTLALLEAMRRAGVSRIVFSSTAAVYGQPDRVPVQEGDPARPTSPYGASKLAVDEALRAYASLADIGAVSLRYFNVAGAHPAGDGSWLGERHVPETHLIPNILAVALAAAGRAEDGAGGKAAVEIFGADYPTADGTCVRDYIHVTDLGRAHLLALAACSPGRFLTYNLGNGAGFSNLEVLNVCREVTGVDIPERVGPRRAGDPAVLVASSRLIGHELGWTAERDLRAMAGDAWAAVCARLAAHGARGG